jgi:hypothetical protein
MSKKAPALPRIAPLQRVIAEPITDPAEQAALDRLRQGQKRKPRGRQTKTTRPGPGTVADRATRKKA